MKLINKLKKSKLTYYVTSFFVLLLLFLIYKNSLNTGLNYENFLKQDIGKIEEITISQNETKINLKKTDKWEITSNEKVFDADDITINLFLNSLKDTKITSTASIDKNSFEDFGVSNTSTLTTLKFISGEEFSFYLGRLTNYSRDENYVRIKDSDETLSISPSINSKLFIEPNDWKDKNIISTDEKNINELSFEWGNTKLSVSKKENIWSHDSKLNSEKIIDETKIQNIISNLKNLRAFKVTDTTNFTPLQSLSFKEQDREHTLFFGKKSEDNLIPVSVSNKPDLEYRIYEHTFNNLFPKFEEILKEQN